ncbi:hypothetical protein FDA94_26605 [Herbidospora galbida]|uniref:AAA+ ATPase domain-containing protein n=1 Tax=Herbidospora galbida TaxID=2575442 RepID=A0A4V5UYK9_9ACTN|nr:hypothetical protein [Herbidospora galbida]TKK85243.1 hypothetical protein FDA94_26605 [Herbidospora galbida]
MTTDGRHAAPTSAPNAIPMHPAPPPPPKRPPGQTITCPICASTLDWESLPLYRWDQGAAKYVDLKLGAGISATQKAQSLRTASIRCADPEQPNAYHYLPYSYGRYGRPSVYGFVGATNSGKTHLLTAMIGQLEKYGLGPGLRHRPITLAGHQYLKNHQIGPFLNDSKVIEHTRLNSIGLVDILAVREGDGTERPIALFDVAGGDLLEIDAARKFLDVADGLFFVVNSDELGGDELGDQTFSTVLELLEASGRLSEVSAAIILGKADLLRFDDPVTRWMRQPDQTLDAKASLEESADVYAYLQVRNAHAWTRPYRDCRKATLHVASATGTGAVENGRFVRGVRPVRVLNPLIALMAMTGVITSEEAKQIGM